MEQFFLHLLVDEFLEGMSIYEIMQGVKEDILTLEGDKLAVKKYTDRKLYKAGDKSKIVLPDLTLIDFNKKEVIDEGEMFQNSDRVLIN